MYESEPRRLADEMRLARTLFPDIDRALADATPSDAEVTLDVRVAELTRGEGTLSVLGLSNVRAEVQEELTRAVDEARTWWPDLEVPPVQAFIERGLRLAAWDDALRDDDTLRAVLAPHGLGAAAWQAQFDAVAGAPTLTLSREVLDEFTLLEWPADRTQMPSVPVTGTRVPKTPAYWTLALIPAADQAPFMGHNHARGTHPLIGELLTVQLSRIREGIGPLDTRTFTWIDGRLGEGKLAARHVYDSSEHTVRVSTREWAQQGPHQGARPPIR